MFISLVERRAQFDGETISKPVSAKMFDAVCRNNSIYGSMSFWESAKPKLECGKAPISNRLVSIQPSFPIARFNIDGWTSRGVTRKRNRLSFYVHNQGVYSNLVKKILWSSWRYSCSGWRKFKIFLAIFYKVNFSIACVF